MIEVRDCYKNVKLHKKNIGLFPYRIVNHPLKDVHDEVEIVCVDIYTDIGNRHFDGSELGDMIEADKHCIYVKGDTCEGRPILDMTVRTKYFYDFEVPEDSENIPLNEAQIGLKLNEMPNCVSLLKTLENNEFNGVLNVYEGPEIGWTETPYLASLDSWSTDSTFTLTTDGGTTYEYNRPTTTSWTVRPIDNLWSDEEIATLREMIEEHRNNE